MFAYIYIGLRTRCGRSPFARFSHACSAVVGVEQDPHRCSSSVVAELAGGPWERSVVAERGSVAW